MTTPDGKTAEWKNPTIPAYQRRAEKVLAALWNDVPVQRSTVHKHRSLLARADRLHDEISTGYKDMIYPETKVEIGGKRKAFSGNGS